MASGNTVALENVTILGEPGGTTLNLHPGMVSEVTIERRGGLRVTAYQQGRVHNLRGMSHPKKHEFRLSPAGGADVGIVFDDPAHRITRVTIELAADDSNTGWGVREAGETITLELQARTCPPVCSDD